MKDKVPVMSCHFVTGRVTIVVAVVENQATLLGVLEAADLPQ